MLKELFTNITGLENFDDRATPDELFSKTYTFLFRLLVSNGDRPWTVTVDLPKLLQVARGGFSFESA
jgi:hypothetical protein